MAASWLRRGFWRRRRSRTCKSGSPRSRSPNRGFEVQRLFKGATPEETSREAEKGDREGQGAKQRGGFGRGAGLGPAPGGCQRPSYFPAAPPRRQLSSAHRPGGSEPHGQLLSFLWARQLHCLPKDSPLSLTGTVGGHLNKSGAHLTPHTVTITSSTDSPCCAPHLRDDLARARLYFLILFPLCPLARLPPRRPSKRPPCEFVSVSFVRLCCCCFRFRTQVKSHGVLSSSA